LRVLLVWLAISCLQAGETCAWLNAATAGGILGGEISDLTVKRAKTADDATCTFVRRQASLVLELRIEVETMTTPAKDFAAYAARCRSAAAPLRAIGNEALACTAGTGQTGRAEQVVGRVRDRAFVVRVSTSDRSAPPETLREKARNVAEQVAGILF
jgi:hypothetical protein